MWYALQVSNINSAKSFLYSKGLFLWSMCIYVHCVQLLWLWEFLFVGQRVGPDACVVRGVWRNVILAHPLWLKAGQLLSCRRPRLTTQRAQAVQNCQPAPWKRFSMLFNIVFSYFQATLYSINLTIISSRDIFTDYMCKLIYKVHLHNLVSI